MKKEALEIPNTEYLAQKGEGYTAVMDRDGNRLATLPPQWTLFDIELWCAGYSIGRAQGIKAGRVYGQQDLRFEIMNALGVMEPIDKLQMLVNDLLLRARESR